MFLGHLLRLGLSLRLSLHFLLGWVVLGWHWVFRGRCALGCARSRFPSWGFVSFGFLICI
jgi:hypothetical protein